MSKAGSALLIALLFAAGTLDVVAQPANPPGRKRPVPEQTPPAPEKTDPAKSDPAPATNPATNPSTNPAPNPATPAKPTTKAPATKPTTPAKSQPAPVTPAVVQKQLVEPGPYITRSDSRDWTLRATVRVASIGYEEVVQDPSSGKQTTMPRRDPVTFENLWVVFPLIPQTASSVPVENAWSARLRLDNKVIADQVTVIPNMTAGTRLGKLSAKGGEGRAVDLEYTVRMMSYKTKLDEAKAKNVGWPLGDWPAVPKSTFQEQMFLDTYPDRYWNNAKLEKDSLKTLVNSWLKNANIKDPKDVNPLMLAKFLTGRVAESFQPNGDGTGTSRNGLLQGISPQPIPITIQTGRGSEFDIVNLLVAVFRQVGLPARLVFAQEGGTADDGFLEASQTGKLRAWAEFCLYDENFEEKRASINWVPVDIITLRKNSTRVPALEKTWRGFGTLEDGNILCPFAFQFHPPTTVHAYGSPGFWGWFMAPKQPMYMDQALSFEATRSATTTPNKSDPSTDPNPPPATTTPPKKPSTPPKKKP